jgi:hypothetical protein
MATERTYWSAPVNDCDVCTAPIGDDLYDMKTKQGPWATMCNRCALHGMGIGRLGLGLGQHYHKEADGKYYLVSGMEDTN